MRKPIAEGDAALGLRLPRCHPILGYSRMHTGVDWANRIGTPIIAAGNGTVIKAEWDSGYGRRVEIQHANGYVTSYYHMSRFATRHRAGRAGAAGPGRSAMSALPASRPARTCITRSSSTAASSTR